MKINRLSFFPIKKISMILLIIVILELMILRAPNSSQVQQAQKMAPQNESQLKIYADEILEKCANEQYRPGCYDREIPPLMDFISLEDAFKVTSIIQDQDREYTYCHVLGHNLSAREVQKDPSRWKEVVSRCPSGMCSNGCIHGGFQEKFRAESLTDEQIEDVKSDLKIICEERENWHPTGLEQASCYHALGHLTMYLTLAEINKSIKLCNEISTKDDGRDYLHLCLDGTFMQIYQPLEPEDFDLIKGKEVKKEQVESFCGNFSGQARGSCLSESWPLFRNEIMNNPQALINFCSKEEKEEQGRCYNGLFYVLTAQFNFDSDKISNYCNALPNNVSGTCFANAASRMIETDYRNINKSVELCNLSKQVESRNSCFNELLQYSTYNFHAGSEEFYKLCNSLPDQWRNKCLNNSKD